MFPFGYGLSYTKFAYRTLGVRPQIVKFTNELIIDVYVVNDGPLDGEEVCDCVRTKLELEAVAIATVNILLLYAMYR
jgi:hypothetical protein